MASPFSDNTIGLDHDDFIHDVQFDFYGNQLATCSSDHKIKIWRKQSWWHPNNQMGTQPPNNTGPLDEDQYTAR